MKNRIGNIGLYATPDSMESFQKYLAKFSGGEGVAAQIGAWMAWNLASKLIAENDEPADEVHKALAIAYIERSSPDYEDIAEDIASQWISNMKYGEIVRWASLLKEDYEIHFNPTMYSFNIMEADDEDNQE